MDFTITITGLLPYIAIVLILFVVVSSYVIHLRAKKKVSEGMLHGGGVEYLINALKDKDPNIQEQAIMKLEELKDPHTIDALIEFVNSKEIREEEDGYRLSLALNALGEIEDLRVMDFFIDILGKKDWVVRYFVCPPLSKLAQRGMKDFRSVKLLVNLLNDILSLKKRKDLNYDVMFEEWVTDALKAITGQDFGIATEKWEKWCSENVLE